MKYELKIGQKVCLKPIGDNARYKTNSIINHLKEMEIKKIGRKYFYVGKENWTDKNWWIKFDFENFWEVTKYSRDWEFYISKQEALDSEEVKAIESKVRGTFKSWGSSGLSLESLRKIESIIEEEINNESK